MSKKIYSPRNILLALNAIEHDLIELVGQDWPQVATKYLELKQALADENREQMASVEVIALFSPYGDARKRLHAAILRQDDLDDVLRTVAANLQRLDLNLQINMDFNEAMQSSSRYRHIVASEIDEVKSFKLGNIQFDLGEMHIFGTAIMAIFAERFVGKDVSPFLIALGILSIAQKLIEEMSIKFDEREATVFYGFSRVVGDDKIASQRAIRKATNMEREKIGLAPLDKTQLRNALHQLEKLKTIERVEGKGENWRIMERFRIKN